MLTSDWHIHSCHSCDSACLPMDEMVRGAAELGIADYGVSDHIHTPLNLPDLRASRHAFAQARPSPRFHFGVELSCVSQWELSQIELGTHDTAVYGIRSGGPAGASLALGVTDEDLRQLDVEYVIGGTHWPMYVAIEREAIVRDYHRQNMFLAAHPLIDIVAHPWWWMGSWQDADGRYTSEPWLDDFRKIPQSMHDEFAAALRQHGTVAEINISAMLLNPCYPERFRCQYVDYLAGLKQAGACLCMGSDCHSARYEIDFETADAMLVRAGIRDDDLWRLQPRSETPAVRRADNDT